MEKAPDELSREVLLKNPLGNISSLVFRNINWKIFFADAPQNSQKPIFSFYELFDPRVSKKSIHHSCSKFYAGSDVAIFGLSLLLKSPQNRIFSSKMAQNGIFTKSVVLTFSFSQKKKYQASDLACWDRN